MHDSEGTREISRTARQRASLLPPGGSINTGRFEFSDTTRIPFLTVGITQSRRSQVTRKLGSLISSSANPHRVRFRDILALISVASF